MIQRVLAIWSLVPLPFLKSFLNIRKFTVHVLLKPRLENFDHYFTSMWDECKCVVVWTFFGIAFLWDWNKNWPLPVQRFSWCTLQKAEEPEVKLPTSAGSWKKQESSRKTSISALLTMPKPLTVWITINCRKFSKSWEYQTTWPASWETCMQVRKQQLELDMEQQTGSK